MDARYSPEPIRQTDLVNQVADLPRNGRAPGCGLVTFPCPINPEPFSVPSDNRFGLHEKQRRGQFAQKWQSQTQSNRSAESTRSRPR